MIGFHHSVYERLAKADAAARDRELRMQAMRIAVPVCEDMDEAIAMADRIVDYVKNGAKE